MNQKISFCYLPLASRSLQQELKRRKRMQREGERKRKKIREKDHIRGKKRNLLKSRPMPGNALINELAKPAYCFIALTPPYRYDENTIIIIGGDKVKNPASEKRRSQHYRPHWRRPNQ